ncbi:hypothetical protein BDP27DRAFT_751774 [Rhodocollybia butyracea]|uniref:Uncharacterized protein n=1 Tax=Rhodocollybia butyracea TaxID=206335 RepID=A0A9P5P5P5_9AGAR|nr:hypothetical protein BDP27DRAFT_751774 [Rhodocollybia butyracea]
MLYHFRPYSLRYSLSSNQTSLLSATTQLYRYLPRYIGSYFLRLFITSEQLELRLACTLGPLSLLPTPGSITGTSLNSACSDMDLVGVAFRTCQARHSHWYLRTYSLSFDISDISIFLLLSSPAESNLLVEPCWSTKGITLIQRGCKKRWSNIDDTIDSVTTRCKDD